MLNWKIVELLNKRKAFQFNNSTILQFNIVSVQSAFICVQSNKYMLCGIILAAGDSSRMGTPKALLKYQGKTFLDAICANMRAAGVNDIIAVLGKHAGEIMADSAKNPPSSPFIKGGKRGGFEIVINPRPEGGQISSLRAGLKALPPGVEAVMIALVDQPMVQTGTYRSLLECWKEKRCDVLIPKYKGKRGHPIILSAPVFSLCFEGPLDKGLHWVTHHEGVSAADVETDDRGVIEDVDTPEDYAEIGRLKAEG